MLESPTVTPTIKFAACDVYLRLAFPNQTMTAQRVFPTIIDLILKESDNNIKLIILGKLSYVLSVASNTLDSQLLDLWKVFSRYLLARLRALVLILKLKESRCFWCLTTAQSRLQQPFQTIWARKYCSFRLRHLRLQVMI